MFVATLETRHFSWMAMGATADEALRSMRKGWNTWRKDTDCAPWSDFEDGVQIHELQPGDCLQDGVLISTLKSARRAS